MSATDYSSGQPPRRTAGHRCADPAAPARMRRTTWPVRVLVGAVLVAAFLVGGTAFRVWYVARADDRRPSTPSSCSAPPSTTASRARSSPPGCGTPRRSTRGLAPRIVTVGGSRAGDAYTEAEAGRRYLIDRGVPASAVVAVGEGSDTLGSLRAVDARAQQDGWDTALVVSDPWHSLRARTMARDSGLEAWTSPTRSGPVVQTRETQARYIVRETAALLYYTITKAPVDTETTGLG